MMSNILHTVFQRTLTPTLQRVQHLSSSTSGGQDAQPPNKQVLNNANIPIVDYEDPDYLPLPEYPIRKNEPLETRKQRLIYQSRKRGMLENDLLLSTFAGKYLKNLNEEQTIQYDHLINGVTNDWDIYYWATDVKPVPPEHDNAIMRMLKHHVSNTEKEQRMQQGLFGTIQTEDVKHFKNSLICYENSIMQAQSHAVYLASFSPSQNPLYINYGEFLKMKKRNKLIHATFKHTVLIVGISAIIYLRLRKFFN